MGVQYDGVEGWGTGGGGACGLRAKSHGGSELGRLNLAAAGGCAAGKDQTLCARGRWESVEDPRYFAIQRGGYFGAIIFDE